MSTPSLDLDQLDALWQNRHETQTIAQLETALAHPQPEYSLLWRAARCFHFRAMQCDDSNDNEQAREYFSQGAEFARKAMELQPFQIEGYFWRGVNEIEAARRTSTLAALAAVKKSTPLIERAANTDETFHFAGPLRVLGRIIHRKPLILGGSAGVAMEYFKRALEIAPDNSTTQIYYVEALLTEQQKPLARRILNEVLGAPDNPDWMWEQARDRKIAQELLKTF